MDIQRQQELIRLWNRMRNAQGPVAAEIRIQILELFERTDAKRTA
jgi:hypothetical protein